jgi:hypothetical protein
MEWSALWIVITLLVISAILCGFIAWHYSELVVLIATAAGGSYLFVRGWSYFFGGFPKESDIYNFITSGEGLKFDSAFWVYFGVFVVCWILCMVWQCTKLYKKKKLPADNDF